MDHLFSEHTYGKIPQGKTVQYTSATIYVHVLQCFYNVLQLNSPFRISNVILNSVFTYLKIKFEHIRFKFKQNHRDLNKNTFMVMRTILDGIKIFFFSRSVNDFVNLGLGICVLLWM